MGTPATPAPVPVVPPAASRRWRAAVVGLPLLVVGHFALLSVVIAVPQAVPPAAWPLLDAYLVPLFAQDWRLFAPRPDLHDYEVFVRGRHRVGDRLEATPWLDLVEPAVSAVQRNRLSPAAVRLEILHKAALFTVRAAGPFSQVDMGRDAVAARWADVRDQPASLIVLERLGMAALAEAYGGLAFETVQVMVAAHRVGEEGAVGAGTASTVLLLRPVPFEDVRVR